MDKDERDNKTGNETADSAGSTNFLYDIIEEDMKTGRFGGRRVCTRFPPEPNGYMHIGHAKSVIINFETAAAFGGKCNVRFDDTNPAKEAQEYIDSILNDVRWLGFDWEDRLYYASDYFDQLYEYAVRLIEKGKAYVDHLSADDIREYRGTLTEPGRNSPYRDRSIAENLDLFQRMKKGEFPDGTCVLRAKIDMASPNLLLRDPVLYRILHVEHHQTGDKWCIYPTYDFAHGQSDSIEGITHSLCAQEFRVHRPLYDWFLDELGIYHSRQVEFGRVAITYTIVSKRYLKRLVEEKYVTGWDDPRMPTISGLRRRGFTPESIRNFYNVIGMTQYNSTVDIKLLEHCVREDLNKRVPRVMAVLQPLKVVIDNYPEGRVEEFEAVNNPENPEAGTRKVPFSRVLYIERDDFMENPPAKFYRLAPGREVRLRYAYFVKCETVVKDAQGNIVELHCIYDPATRGGYAPDGRKVKSTIHWVAATHALEAEVRLYDYLFTVPNPSGESEDHDFTADINPKSLEVLQSCRVEPSLAEAKPGDRYQFERLGYFCVDLDSKAGKLVFNRTLTLRDDWVKTQQKQPPAES